MTLSSKERKTLRAQAHHLKAVVRIGQHGVSDGVIAETDIALTVHELIKVHIQGDDRDARLLDAQKLYAATQSELVSQVGKMFILYRQNPDKKASA